MRRQADEQVPATLASARFANDDAVMGFEIFNEPVTDDAGVRRLDDAALARVRAAAPDKLYLFEPPATRNIIDRFRKTWHAGPA